MLHPSPDSTLIPASSPAVATPSLAGRGVQGSGTAAFIGRQRELDLIFQHVLGPHRGHVALSGPLGIGKSRLLRQIADPELQTSYGLDPRRTLVLPLDLQAVTPFSGSRFWRRVAQLLLRRLADNIGPALKAGLEGLLGRDDLDIVDIEELLDLLAEQDQVLVLLIDELEWALQAEAEGAASRDFLAQTASLARRSPRVLVLVTATARPLHEATREVEGWRGSPFATVFTALPLAPLTPDLALAYLGGALVRAGWPANPSLLAPIVEEAGGQPAALEAAARCLERQGREPLNAADLQQAALRAVREVLAHLSALAPGQASARPAPRPAPAGPSPRGLWLDPAGGEVVVHGRRVKALTSLEYSLLQLFYGRPGQICSKEDILRHVWGADPERGNNPPDVDEARVEKLVSRLRHKIEPVPGRPQFLRTVRGRGYRYVAQG